MKRKRRIFHSIGQGAFYTEHHDDINIVYDCGHWRNSKLSDKVVTQAFKCDETIDILFISHLDYDHVSKINTLKKHVRQIKRVVLPLLHKDEKIFLSDLTRHMGQNIQRLINNPESFFGKETRLLYVEPTEAEGRDSPETDEGTDMDRLFDDPGSEIVTVPSGTVLRLNELRDWVFIPHNYRFADRNNELETILEDMDVNLREIKEGSSRTLASIVEDIRVSERLGGKIFKGIYASLNGNINENSMFLYSGPVVNSRNASDCKMINVFSGVAYSSESESRPGCIYTGDGNLNKVDIKSVFRNYWDKVEVIQIPHHGDIKAFNKDSFADRSYLCPISVGMTNSYGHPSERVLAELMAQRCVPLLIRDTTHSTCQFWGY